MMEYKMHISDWSSYVCSSERAGRDPSSIPPEDAVPLAILVRQMPPLRTGPGNPHHALEIAAIILCRAAATAALSRQQRPDQRPLLIRYTDPLAQRCLHKLALNQALRLSSRSVHTATISGSNNEKASCRESVGQYE